MSYPSDLSDAQWELLEPLLGLPSKSGPKHGSDLRTVVNAMLYITKTGCQWRYLPSEFGHVSFSEVDDGVAFGVVDEITRRVWESRGTVFGVRREDVPGGGGVAAIMRYAL